MYQVNEGSAEIPAKKPYLKFLHIMPIQWFVLLLLSMFLGCEGTDQNVITILAIGRSGAGVSSTVRELIGPNTRCGFPNQTISFYNHITEYTLTLTDSSSSAEDEASTIIKLVDLPGLVETRSLEEDAKTLESLNSFVQTSGFPDYLLAVSNFDDRNFTPEQSPFVQFLKRVELVRALNFGNKTHTVFLFTRLMSENRIVQRRPENKTHEFRQAIQIHTLIRQPLMLVVGDNNARRGYKVDVDGGYYKLPNKELYPKNVWQNFINVSPNGSERNRRNLTFMMNNRELQMKCTARFIAVNQNGNLEDEQDLQYLIEQPNIVVQQNEVNAKIDEEFDKASVQKRHEHFVQKLALQIRLQNMNITRIQDMPKSITERAAFLQEDRFASPYYAKILSEVFEVRHPEYNKDRVVGSGYDLLSDELTHQTPFRVDSLRASEVGYVLPDFIKCEKYFGSDKDFRAFSQNYSEYVNERSKLLDMEESLADIKFAGKVKEGFNIKPNKSETTITLSAVQEVRVVRCELDAKHLNLSDEFLNAVDFLTEFNSSDRDSVNEWVIFFNKFGSHLVTKAYGGGSLRGFMTLSGRDNMLFAKSKTQVSRVLNALVEFNALPNSNLGSPFYRFDGGIPNYRMEQLYDLESEIRDSLFLEWIESLSSNYVMLSYELGLAPISAVVRMVSEEKGEFVQNAMELLLRGDLKYSRRRNTPIGNVTRVKTAKKYMPARFKNIINRLNSTMEQYRLELEEHTDQIRQQNLQSDREFEARAREEMRRKEACNAAFGRFLCDGIFVNKNG
ncbi:GTPase IMAP family member 5 [Orchesella cincta]|uniref:GTPase IMAP family member 5 n=1 Tax=Orchesella cincta TaxID=48709 RepID=A0A1D2N9A4_ORCCI|nr:GTPase IMAP family member 5 [Orchesella cincta]